MELIHYLVDVFLHLDTHLNDLAVSLGPLLYALLFLIIFAETGLVVTPFLPGDSLLFAIGALAAIDGSPIHVGFAVVLLASAAVLGDAVNYGIGYRIGPRVFTSETSRLLNKEHLVRTQRFYERYGGKTIILARFMPIVRTFAPFVAGIGRMRYAHFAAYNVVGGAVWVAAFTLAGYFFGNVPVVKRNFHFVIVAIIVISVIPPVLEFLRARRSPVAE
ncbi:MAG TPA: DedA family protein [Candidatus Dormibacteraeota bacterium]|nr:DedA family protein [Candidatus Dormibacteraeota bacterium]